MGRTGFAVGGGWEDGVPVVYAAVDVIDEVTENNILDGGSEMQTATTNASVAPARSTAPVKMPSADAALPGTRVASPAPMGSPSVISVSEVQVVNNFLRYVVFEPLQSTISPTKSS